MSALFEAPSDPQLSYIASLCEDRGIAPPEAVHSKTEASEIINAIKTRQYDPRRYRVEQERAVNLGEMDAGEIETRARYEAARSQEWNDVPF